MFGNTAVRRRFNDSCIFSPLSACMPPPNELLQELQRGSVSLQGSHRVHLDFSI
ncbi:hypothetical protein RND71_039772 [Anisodus tanguticus]|uniref:Uncharacterized protein n=1 Tax=Anisodus tanguticus TaxID=243964 RepID=A0AAE1QXG3_9SOLA|nr:hypothetical protein RND71_039772 [Anisodus tanguticus]